MRERVSNNKGEDGIYKKMLKCKVKNVLKMVDSWKENNMLYL